VSRARSLWTRAALGAALLLSCAACSVVPPGQLEEDPRWRDLMRDGSLPSRGRVYVTAPRLARAAELVLEAEVPVALLGEGRSYYCPPLPEGFARELREILLRNSGYEVVLWDPAAPEAKPPAEADYVLDLRVERYQFELLEAGQGSAMAAMWIWGFPHLTTFYNAPDELYRCDYRVQARLRPRAAGNPSRSRWLRGSSELLLTDLQRGWTFASYWPEQKLNWTGGKELLEAWREYGPHVEAATEPHARRSLLIDLMRFLRDPPLASEGD
jgi:hypothetical protein